jgi:hypothetical protein
LWPREKINNCIFDAITSISISENS